MSENIKLCKDCLYCRRDALMGYEFAKCSRPELNSDGNFFVAGVGSTYCSTQRGFRCGPEAKYFEPKPPKPPSWWQQIKEVYTK